MADSEIIELDEPDKKSDFIQIFTEAATSLNFKLIFILFLIFMLITSNIFVDKVISRISPDSVINKTVKTKGAFIQGIMICLLYIVMDMVIKMDVL